MDKTLISEFGIQNYFWAKAVNRACYILNKVFIKKVLNKTPYELWKGGKPHSFYEGQERYKRSLN